MWSMDVLSSPNLLSSCLNHGLWRPGSQHRWPSKFSSVGKGGGKPGLSSCVPTSLVILLFTSLTQIVLPIGPKDSLKKRKKRLNLSEAPSRQLNKSSGIYFRAG